MTFRVRYPTTQALAEFFGVDVQTQEDVWTFSVSGPDAVELEFSFDPIADSVQTRVLHRGQQAAVTSHEGVTEVRIDGTMLFVQCVSPSYAITLRLAVAPAISVEWAGLRT
jgi:hypothetical protein